MRCAVPAHARDPCGPVQVMIPGMAAWGMVVCTGSNLLVRAAVVQAIGGFPGKTITEDYMLGLELAKHGWKSRYLQKYLALGAAPACVQPPASLVLQLCTAAASVLDDICSLEQMPAGLATQKKLRVPAQPGFCP